MGFHPVYPSAGPFPNEPQPVTLTVSFWRRLVAFGIDGILLGIANRGLDQLANAFPQWPAWGEIIGFLSWAVAPVYFILAYSTSGQTPGKQWLGLKIVSIDGSPLTWRQGVLRFIGYTFSDLSFSLGYLWSIWDEEKQAWHDKIAGTRVVPASASAEQVRLAFNQMQLRKRSGAWKWVAGAIVGLELALAACIVVALFVTATTQPQPQLHDDEWTRFEQALSARVNPDPRIPSFSTHRDYGVESGKASDIWLVMEMTYDADCEMGGVDDWCYRLTNEMIQIVFDNYPHIDEINGIRVVMTKTSQVGPVEFNYTAVDEALSISEWRQRLSGSGQ